MELSGWVKQAALYFRVILLASDFPSCSAPLCRVSSLCCIADATGSTMYSLPPCLEGLALQPSGCCPDS